MLGLAPLGASLAGSEDCGLVLSGAALVATSDPRRVAAMPEVLSCYMVSGSIDFVLEVVAPSLLAYADFIDNRLLKLRGVKDASSRLVLRTIKPPSPYSVR